MTRFIKPKLRRFLRDEEGSANTIEFALWLPVFLMIILATVEVGAMTMRHTQLERALDDTVRDIRLGTGDDITHAAIKTSICERAPLLADCEANLQLEMLSLDLRSWSNPPSSVDCVDTSRDVNPAREFTAGQDNELMYLRACYKYEPIAMMAGMPVNEYLDEQGYRAVVSFSAFVQEPSS
ncbi:MAG TPA: TadE/TadG family type IV pilus assembly protein [Marivita sp.]|nr:TadE/TadG family type IV pilus assembly protein [Marivita sp.]